MGTFSAQNQDSSYKKKPHMDIYDDNIKYYETSVKCAVQYEISMLCVSPVCL